LTLLFYYARVQVLRKWKEKKGLEATCSTLLKAFLKAKHADLARHLTNLCGNGLLATASLDHNNMSYT